MLVDIDDGGCIEVVVSGDQPDVVLVPSAQRGAADFERLADDLWAAGHGSVALNPRGVGASSPVPEHVTLRVLAADVAGVAAAYHPDLVRSITLLACGGHDVATAPPPEDVLVHFKRCHRTDLPDEVRIESLGRVFFAAGNDPSAWLAGWWPSADVRGIFDTTDPAEWYTAGAAEVLIVLPLEDILCPRQVGLDLRDAIGPRARYVEVAHCGHAVLPEQPEAVAAAIVAFLAAQAVEA